MNIWRRRGSERWRDRQRDTGEDRHKGKEAESKVRVLWRAEPQTKTAGLGHNGSREVKQEIYKLMQDGGKTEWGNRVTLNSRGPSE